jgi:serine/threonine protein kinase
MGGGLSKGDAAAAKSEQDLGSATKVYRLGSTLGSGSFATVYTGNLICQSPPRVGANGVTIPEEVAIKVIDKKKLSEGAEKDAVMEEVRVQSSVHHPNCVGLYEYFNEKDKLYLVLELVKGGELFDQIVEKGYFNEREAAHTVQQIALALAYLEERKIVHRDLKPENLIFSKRSPDAVLKLTDFGLAKDISHESSSEPLNDPCGTPGYVAPEVLMSKPYGLKVDMWAVGVILYTVLCGYPPFYSEDQQALFSQIKKAVYVFDSPYWDDVSKGAKEVVSKLLVANPHKRLSAKELLELDWVKDPHSQNTAHLGKHVIEGIEKLQKNAKFKRAVAKVKALKKFDKLLLATKGVAHAENHDAAHAEHHGPAGAAAAAAVGAPAASAAAAGAALASPGVDAGACLGAAAGAAAAGAGGAGGAAGEAGAAGARAAVADAAAAAAGATATAAAAAATAHAAPQCDAQQALSPCLPPVATPRGGARS